MCGEVQKKERDLKVISLLVLQCIITVYNKISNCEIFTDLWYFSLKFFSERFNAI